MNIGDGTYVGPANISATIEDMWYNSEIGLYPGYGQNTVDMTNFQLWGHFSQVVWQDTTEIGCWAAACGPDTPIGSGYFAACIYSPPGNYVGDFTKVGAPNDESTIHGN